MQTRHAEIPGTYRLVLPPMYLGELDSAASAQLVLDIAKQILQKETVLGEQMDPKEALRLAEAYAESSGIWKLGQAIYEWIAWCKSNARITAELEKIFPLDLWPSLIDPSFAHLLKAKLKIADATVEIAIGSRLMYHELPAVSFFASHGLLHMREQAKTAYDRWLSVYPEPIILLPPDRFDFQIINLATANPFTDSF